MYADGSKQELLLYTKTIHFLALLTKEKQATFLERCFGLMICIAPNNISNQIT